MSTDNKAEHSVDEHTHGTPDCAHQSIQHGDHLDYLHDGHRHAPMTITTTNMTSPPSTASAITPTVRLTALTKRWSTGTTQITCMTATAMPVMEITTTNTEFVEPPAAA